MYKRDRNIAVSDYYQKIEEALFLQDKDCLYYIQRMWEKFEISLLDLPKSLYEENKN